MPRPDSKNTDSKTFIVTGCNGYIGSHMCYELRQYYPNCVILGIDMVAKPHLRHLYNEFTQINLSRDVPDYSYYNIDCIFHFAALASVPQGEQFKYTYYRNNLQSSLNMIELANTHSVDNFIFSSTCAVYGEPEYIPLNETHPKNPVSVYAKTKSVIEDVLMAAEENNLLRAGILRYFNAAGRNVEANLYEEHEPETHLIPLLARNDTIDLYGDDYNTPDGTCIRDYIHVIDVCQAHIKAYKYMEKHKKGIVCNVGTGRAPTVLEVIHEVERILDKKMAVNIKPRRPGDVPYLVADTTKMQKELTFTPKYDMVSIIQSLR